MFSCVLIYAYLRFNILYFYLYVLMIMINNIYHRKSLKRFDVFTVAMGSILLASKVEECFKTLREVYNIKIMVLVMMSMMLCVMYYYITIFSIINVSLSSLSSLLSSSSFSSLLPYPHHYYHQPDIYQSIFLCIYLLYNDL